MTGKANTRHLVTHPAVSSVVEDLRRKGFGIAGESPHLLLGILGSSHVDVRSFIMLAFENHPQLLLVLLNLCKYSYSVSPKYPHGNYT